jgi:MFS family permease
MSMSNFQPADNLRSRTFLGLLVAQFLAAFNDQAIHASSMFFAINQNAMSESSAISLMPILFYAPWALFCTLSGYLADKYSKWNSLVFWKFAEIAITLVALGGFWLGTHGIAAGPYLVLSTVFLMGTHSAFFVPAKYGAMPEILEPQMLSRGNGLLESLSFLAVILGTVVGGVLSKVFRGQEYYIGLILVGLAVVGALASLLIRRMPAANPRRSFPPYLYQPLWENIRGLLRSRPLALSVVGIAFFTFIVAFMRSTMYMHGETRIPRWEEDKTSEVVGMVALGIGLGSPLVGFLSGGKVELGLTPVGAIGMIISTLVAALALDDLRWLILCITLIGFFTGFYIVPLFTLLQHRAPKTSKGDSIATSNFINVTGAIVSSVLFFLLVRAAHVSGITPRLEETDRTFGVLLAPPDYDHGRISKVVIGPAPALMAASTLGLAGSADGSAPLRAACSLTASDKPPRVVRANRLPQPRLGRTRPRSLREIDVDEDWIDTLGQRLTTGDLVIESVYRLGSVTHHRIRRADQVRKPVYNEAGLPRMLFVSAGAMTLLTLFILWRMMPDLLLRTFIWLWIEPRYRLEIDGLHHLPGNGPVLLLTNAVGMGPCLQVLSATDRTTHCLLMEETEGPGWLLRHLTDASNLARLPAGTRSVDAERLRAKANRLLDRQEVVGLPLGGPTGPAVERLFQELTAHREVPVLPVYYEAAPQTHPRRRQRVFILAGDLLPAGSSLDAVRGELQRLAESLQQKMGQATPAAHAYSESH